MPETAAPARLTAPQLPPRIHLDARLAAAAAFVRPGSVAADIGCDHGLLSVQLARSGRCRKVIACDIRPKPLAVAAANFARCGCAALCECRLGDGLTVLRPGEASDIVIAGVSGITMMQMLTRAPAFWRPGERFVLVPASKAAQLRRFLCENGFALLAETPVCAQGRFYPVLCAEYTGEKTQPDALFCAIGLCVQPTAASLGLLAKTAGCLRKEGAAPLADAVDAARARMERAMRAAAQSNVENSEGT